MGLGWLIRLLILLLIIRAVWSFVAGLLRGLEVPRQVPPGRAVALVRDPVCGTFVDPSRALTAELGAARHYFCSERCRDAFRPGAE